MAEKEDILYALELFHKSRPQHVFDEMKNNDMGSFAVIKYIHEVGREVNSAEICKHLKISSARMVVLIRKLEAKNLVVKVNSTNDSRSKIIMLSDKGKETVKRMHDQMYKSAEKVVDEFGIEALKELFDNLNKLKTILKANAPTVMEDEND